MMRSVVPNKYNMGSRKTEDTTERISPINTVSPMAFPKMEIASFVCFLPNKILNLAAAPSPIRADTAVITVVIGNVTVVAATPKSPTPHPKNI